MAEHDSDVWETVSGWIWSCRTCLARAVYDTEVQALIGRQEHDARPLPWWVPLIGADR